MGLPIPPDFTPEKLLLEHRKAIKSSQFYYTEEQANNVKKLLDTLHTTKESLFIQAGDNSISTLRVKYYQGKDYLLDNLDPNKHYLYLTSLTKVTTKPGGLLFSVRIAPKNKVSLLDFVVVIPDWRTKLEDFLETATPNQKFFLENLKLSDKDLTWISNQLAGLTKTVDEQAIPLFYGEITPDKILLIRDED